MKILHLAMIAILTICLVITNHEAFGYANNVKILNIHTQPSTIKVGDKFTITTTLANNTPDPTFLTLSPCGEPFTINFDNHVKVDYITNLACPAFAFLQKVNPGEGITLTSPSTPITPSGKPSTYVSETVVFRAISSGTANTTISFPYFIQNQTDHSNIPKTISEQFQFLIHDINETYVQKPPAYFESPLQQIKAGVSAQNVNCGANFSLIIKSEDGSPACVKPDTATKLIALGWAVEDYGHTTAVEPFDTLKMNVIGTDFSFNYTILGGQLENTTANIQNKSLYLSMRTTENGTLIVILPRGLLDPKVHSQDSPFIIIEDGKEVDYRESTSSITSRMLIVPFQYGVSKIAIIAPEPVR